MGLAVASKHDGAGSNQAEAFLGASLAMSAGDAAVLSVLCVREAGEWTVIGGSFLSMPSTWAYTSWARWHEFQPSVNPYLDPNKGFDLGPNFDTQPFVGLRIARTIVGKPALAAALRGIAHGRVRVGVLDARLETSGWSPTGLLTQNGMADAHKVVAGTQRPVVGVVTSTRHPAIPASDSTWAWPLPPHLRPGPDLGSIAPHRKLLFWPRELLGIDWMGDPRFPPPSRFVVGRLQDRAWIVGVRPNQANEQLDIHIGWNEQTTDPLGLSLMVRSESEGLLLIAGQTRISDLPSRPERDTNRPRGVEPRHRQWSERLLTVSLPRGPRRTPWGVALIAADGQLLDERPVAPRLEQIVMRFTTGRSSSEALTTVAGDRRDYPTRAAQDEATRLRADLDLEARRAAASRRFSDAGQIPAYLHWRFSCRAGELLLLDPYLLTDRRHDLRSQDLAFLQQLDRPVRALTGKLASNAAAEANESGFLNLRRLPYGVHLHDRVWIVGDTALLLGSSVNGFLPGRGTSRATTASELPHADALLWKERFEEWWAAAAQENAS